MDKLQDLVSRRDEICGKIGQMADTLKREQRSRTEAEEGEYKTLCREKQELDMRITAFNVPAPTPQPQERSLDAILRENLRENRSSTLRLRDYGGLTTSDLTDKGIVPVKQQQVLEPLEKGLILDKIGIPIPTGLGGEYVWVTFPGGEATINGEAVAITDSKLTLTKYKAQPERIGYAIPATRETLNQTDGLMERIVTQELPKSVARTINKVMFSTTKQTGATNMQGPFVGLTGTYATSLSHVPTYAELATMKGKIFDAGAGDDATYMCWVMTGATKAMLEATPRDAGSGLMMIENDKLLGLPVFATQYIGDTKIGLGNFAYCPVGIFGDMSITVDPFSKARQNVVDFVINVNFATTCVRKEAFNIGTMAAAN